jgi:diaminopropionate ammonia-lyase
MSPDALGPIVDRDIALFENPHWRPGAHGPLAERYHREAATIARALESAPGYAPTPCYRLERLAAALGCTAFHFKDEGARFGLGSFKSAGVVYAMFRHVERLAGKSLDPAAVLRGDYRKLLAGEVFATATSGNHGRALAWMSRCVGARCIIYAPRECSEGRIAEMARHGAEIVRTGLYYNPSMARCRADCAKAGWTIFADTSWDGYVEIPTDIMLGYAHIIRELAFQVADWSAITHIVIQGGVGAFAAGLLTGLSAIDPQARIEAVVVEPKQICALAASARAGHPTAVTVREMSVMTGISNEEVSPVAWSVLAERVRWFAGLGDASVRPCLRFFSNGAFDDVRIEMGETATAGAASWISLMRTAHRPTFGPKLGVVVFGCEGVTDRAVYERLLAE